MSKIKIMEGFGLPGAGKSTCIAMLKNDSRLPESIRIYLRKEGDTKFLDMPSSNSIKKRKILSKYNAFRYLMIRPALCISVIRSIIVFRFNKDYIYVLQRLIVAMDCRSKVRTSGKKMSTMLLDEGLIQYLGASVINTSTDIPLPKKLIKHVLSNYIRAMIYFEVDNENAINRIKKRRDGISRIERMDSENAFLNLSKMQNTFTLCIEIANSLGIPVLILRNGNSVDDNIARISDFLNNFLQKAK